MADHRFSLTRVRLRHYRSIASADVTLGNLLLLVGPNGSGKSNFQACPQNDRSSMS
jgi:predicted ATPase